MALATYSDLKSAVADYLDRSDLTSAIADFITLVEANMNYGDDENVIVALRHRKMETTATSALTSGALTLAADFLEMRRVTLLTDPRTRLTYLSPDSFEEYVPTTQDSTLGFYTILGDSLIVRASNGENVEYAYYQKIPALTDSNTTNWVLTAAPGVYLYGALYHAHVYLENPEGAIGMLQLFRNALGGLRSSDKMNQAGAYIIRASGVSW